MLSPPPSPTSVGSDSWTNGEQYEEGGEFQRRALKFLDDVKWRYLIDSCSRLRRGVGCHLASRFSLGHFNMVRRVIFDDGVTWVARLRMPPIEGDKTPQNLERSLSSEVACMNFLRANTSIPVPRVYHYDLKQNEVGAPYILMDYIPGIIASDLMGELGICDQYGTPEQDRKFRRSMAAIQVQLASIKFDEIGSLYQDPVTEDFFIGPESETGLGPWKSSLDYYHSLLNKKEDDFYQKAPLEVQHDQWSFAIPMLFKFLLDKYIGHDSPRGPFGLVHQDFGAHNLLVNENFEILAVIDFDGFMTAPIEVQAQFPNLTGLDMETPFYEPQTTFVKERIEETRPKLVEYKGMIQELEKRDSSIQEQTVQPGDLMLSDTAHIVYGLLQCYDMYDGEENGHWVHAYLRLLHKKSRLSTSKFEYGEAVGVSI